MVFRKEGELQCFNQSFTHNIVTVWKRELTYYIIFLIIVVVIQHTQSERVCDNNIFYSGAQPSCWTVVLRPYPGLNFVETNATIFCAVKSKPHASVLPTFSFQTNFLAKHFLHHEHSTSSSKSSRSDDTWRGWPCHTTGRVHGPEKQRKHDHLLQCWAQAGRVLYESVALSFLPRVRQQALLPVPSGKLYWDEHCFEPHVLWCSGGLCFCHLLRQSTLQAVQPMPVLL